VWSALRQSLSSAAFVVVAGAVLWPPGAVYWTAVAAVVGDGVALAVVGMLAVALGAGFAHATAVDVPWVAAGGAVAYVAGMVVVDVVIQPESPVHYVLYAGVLVALVAGAALSAWWRDRSDRTDRSDHSHRSDRNDR
jgi:hypothetical protein